MNLYESANVVLDEIGMLPLDKAKKVIRYMCKDMLISAVHEFNKYADTKIDLNLDTRDLYQTKFYRRLDKIATQFLGDEDL